jgi:hypothetical protein
MNSASDHSIFLMVEPGNTKGGSILFDWFGLVCFANKNKKMSVVIQLIPNQPNRRSTVQ